MIDTTGLGGGSYPEPDWCYEEVIDEEPDEWDIADEYHDLMMIGEIE